MADEKTSESAGKPEPKKEYVPPGICDFCKEGRFLGCDERCPNCGRVGAYYGG